MLIGSPQIGDKIRAKDGRVHFHWVIGFYCSLLRTPIVSSCSLQFGLLHQNFCELYAGTKAFLWSDIVHHLYAHCSFVCCWYLAGPCWPSATSSCQNRASAKLFEKHLNLFSFFSHQMRSPFMKFLYYRQICLFFKEIFSASLLAVSSPSWLWLASNEWQLSRLISLKVTFEAYREQTGEVKGGGETRVSKTFWIKFEIHPRQLIGALRPHWLNG